MYVGATDHSRWCLAETLPWQRLGFAKHTSTVASIFMEKKGGESGAATYCVHNDYFGEGGETGERVSHQALDVAAWEGVGVEVHRQTAVSNEEGMLEPGSGPGNRATLLRVSAMKHQLLKANV